VQPLVVAEAQQLRVVGSGPADGAGGRVAVEGGEQRLLLRPAAQVEHVHQAVRGAGRQPVVISRVEAHLRDVVAVRLRVHPEEPAAGLPDVPEHQEAVLAVHLLGAGAQQRVAAAQVEAAVAVRRVAFKHLRRVRPGAPHVPPADCPVGGARVEEAGGGVGEDDPAQRPPVAPVLAHQAQGVPVVEADGQVGAAHGQRAGRLQGHVQQVGGLRGAGPPGDGQPL